MDADSKTFVIHVAISERKEIVMDPVKKAQIKVQSGAQSKAQIGTLIFNKVSTKVLAEYSDCSNVFSAENVTKLLENTRINEYTIKQKENKQPSFCPIYSLGLVELKTLKSYIKTNLANNFICLFKSPAGTPILFNKKLDGSFCLCIDYWGLINITFKNQYSLSLMVSN